MNFNYFKVIIMNKFKNYGKSIKKILFRVSLKSPKKKEENKMNVICEHCHLLGHQICEEVVDDLYCTYCHVIGHTTRNLLCPNRCPIITFSCPIHNINKNQENNSVVAWQRFTRLFRPYCSVIDCYENAQFALHAILNDESFYRLIPMCYTHSHRNTSRLRLISDSNYPVLNFSHTRISGANYFC